MFDGRDSWRILDDDWGESDPVVKQRQLKLRVIDGVLHPLSFRFKNRQLLHAVPALVFLVFVANPSQRASNREASGHAGVLY